MKQESKHYWGFIIHHFITDKTRLEPLFTVPLKHNTPHLKQHIYAHNKPQSLSE